MDFSGAFIDWLSIREPNTGQFEPLNDGYVIVLDSEGVERFTTERSLQVDGSFDSSCRVRVTQTEREISFNPSRWNREDNLFGVDFAEAVARANQVFESFGQPAVSPGVRNDLADGSVTYSGAVLTRVDVTMNLITGSASALADYFWYLSGLKLNFVETRRKRNTVYYGQDSRKRVIKTYLKHLELQAHKSKGSEYVRALAEWCEAVGLARLEVRYGRDFLRANALRALGSVSHSALVRQFAEDIEPMLKEFDQLDLSELSASQKGVLMLYLNGFDLRKEFSQAQFYRYRRKLKEVTGYDIANDNVTRVEPKPRKIVLEAASPPDWYEMPERLLVKKEA